MDESQNTPRFRGLYRHVRISVKTLDRIILGCIVVIILAVILGLQDPGYLVQFDPNGGTDVPSAKYQYGDPIAAPEPPTREGYVFDGWYFDTGLTEKWIPELHTVSHDLTLYARWVPKT